MSQRIWSIGKCVCVREKYQPSIRIGKYDFQSPMQCTFAIEMCHHFHVCECKSFVFVCVCVLVSLKSTLFARRKEYKHRQSCNAKFCLFVLHLFSSIASTNVECVMYRNMSFVYVFISVLFAMRWYLSKLLVLFATVAAAARETTSAHTLCILFVVLSIFGHVCVYSNQNKNIERNIRMHAIPLLIQRIFSAFLARSMRIKTSCQRFQKRINWFSSVYVFMSHHNKCCLFHSKCIQIGFEIVILIQSPRWSILNDKRKWVNINHFNDAAQKPKRK